MKELQKSQLLRLWDLFGLGPFMIWYAYSNKKKSRNLKHFMAALGVLTMTYNGYNYLQNVKLIKEGKIIPQGFLREVQL